MTAEPDLSTPASGGSHDMAQASSGGGDLAMKSNADGGNGGLLPLCQTCTQNTDCATGMCLGYMGGAIKKCSHSCAAATAATDCPGVNACNNASPPICKCM